MYRVVSLICIFVQLLHLFEYFNVSLLARFISVFLKFNLCDFLNMCNVYLCVIFNISLMLFMSLILYKPLAIWSPGHDKSLFFLNKIELN